MSMTKIDSKLHRIYDEAWRVLEDNQEELLRYNDTSSLKKAMYNIDSVVVNRRSNTRRGCCKHLDSNTVKVELSEYMLSLPEKEAITTMVHELLHCFRDSRGHKGNWLWRANYLKSKTGLNITRVRTIENEYELRKDFYDHRKKMTYRKNIVCKCDKCDYEIIRHRESTFTKHPCLYKHTGCGGTFVRVGERVVLN